MELSRKVEEPAPILEACRHSNVCILFFSFPGHDTMAGESARMRKVCHFKDVWNAPEIEPVNVQVIRDFAQGILWSRRHISLGFVTRRPALVENKEQIVGVIDEWFRGALYPDGYYYLRH